MTRRKHGETGGNRGEEVIGHARLMPVAGKKGAAFVETGKSCERLGYCLSLYISTIMVNLVVLILLFLCAVVVARRLRGCGLGRRIMEVAESHAAEMNYRSVHLSTHDKVSFYSHLGYVSGPKVSPLRKCVANLTNEEVHLRNDMYNDILCLSTYCMQKFIQQLNCKTTIQNMDINVGYGKYILFSVHT